MSDATLAWITLAVSVLALLTSVASIAVAFAARRRR